MIFVITIEFPALHHPTQCALLLVIFAAAAAGLRIYNRQHAKTAVLYFEEIQPEMVTQLKISSFIAQTPTRSELSNQ